MPAGHGGNKYQATPKTQVEGGWPKPADPDLNVPAEASNAIVPVGLVSSRLNQLDGGSKKSGESMVEMLKKQKRGTTSQNA